MEKTLVVKFRISGNLSYLSHRETMTVFERAMVRSRIKLSYSGGFNPRPRFCLPLPRSVGTSSDDELMYGMLNVSEDQFNPEEIKGLLSEQMPGGCEILDVRIEQGRKSYSADEVVYGIRIDEEHSKEKLDDSVSKLSQRMVSGETISIDRALGSRKGIRNIEVGKYILAVECVGRNVKVKCLVSPSGTIRIDEILRLLNLNQRSVYGTVCRKSVRWNKN